MKVSHTLARVLLLILSILFFTTYALGKAAELSWLPALIGIGIGLGFGAFLLIIDLIFKRFNLRAYNASVIGLFFGYLMGLALVSTYRAVVAVSALSLDPSVDETIKIGLILFGLYTGVMMTLRAANELYVSIPFVKFTRNVPQARDLILDGSILADGRVIDLAATGIFDRRLLLPRFVVKELYAQAERADEVVRARARRSLEAVKKLEEILSLKLRYQDTDFPEVQDLQSKLVRLARLVDADLLTADIDKIQSATIEGVRIINIHHWANALKPLMETGEFLDVKIQRRGKEPGQGVGYLDDGTMVVVNGGGEAISQEIKTRVLSVKHTASGRIIFCNALDGYRTARRNGPPRPYREEEYFSRP